MSFEDSQLGEKIDRRKADHTNWQEAGAPDCKAVFVLERRVNNHAQELKALKEMMATNNDQTKEILEIIGLGRSFFRVLGWVGEMIKPVIVIAGAIAAVVAWVKTGAVK